MNIKYQNLCTIGFVLQISFVILFGSKRPPLKVVDKENKNTFRVATLSKQIKANLAKYICKIKFCIKHILTRERNGLFFTLAPKISYSFA